MNTEPGDNIVADIINTFARLSVCEEQRLLDLRSGVYLRMARCVMCVVMREALSMTDGDINQACGFNPRLPGASWHLTLGYRYLAGNQDAKRLLDMAAHELKFRVPTKLERFASSVMATPVNDNQETLAGGDR